MVLLLRMSMSMSSNFLVPTLGCLDVVGGSSVWIRVGVGVRGGICNRGVVLFGPGCSCFRGTGNASASLLVASGGLAGNLAGSRFRAGASGGLLLGTVLVLFLVVPCHRVHGLGVGVGIIGVVEVDVLWLLLGLVLGGPVVQCVRPGLFVEEFPAGGGLLRGKQRRRRWR